MAYAPHPNAAYRVIDDHVFIITSVIHQHELVGDVELLVWHLVSQNECSLKELLDAVLERFDVDQKTANEDLRRFLEEMVQAGVLCAAGPKGGGA